MTIVNLCLEFFYKSEKRSLKDCKERDKADFPVINQTSGMVDSPEAYKILIDFIMRRGYSG